MKKFLLLFVGIFLLSFSSVLSFEIQYCGGLVESGVYTLTRDIVGSSSKKCMEITATYVTLDCQGHTIDGNRDGYGIYTNKNNIVIKNCAISGWEYGIYHYSGAYGKIENNIIKSNDYGINIDEGDFNEITNNVIESNDYGIMLYGSISNNIIKNNEIKSNSKGIYFECKGNCGEIYNNLFSNDNNVVVRSGEFVWNTTKQLGDRIYGEGDYIGGNYWTNPSGTGHSDTCTDVGNCICSDQPYDVHYNRACGPGTGYECSDNVDYLPLTYCCPGKCCYGEWVVYNKDAKGPYNCISDGVRGNCKYSEKEEECKTGAEDSDGGIDYKEKGTCIAYQGCNGGKCDSDEPKEDFCQQTFPDVDGDKDVDIYDIVIIATAYGTKPGDEKWDSRADVAEPYHKIDIYDMVIACKYYGEKAENFPGAGSLLEYYTSDGYCKHENKNCSQEFAGDSLLGGAEWKCDEGACVGCQKDEDCYGFIKDFRLGPGKECIFTSCSVNKCAGVGYVRDWYCDTTTQYCKYTDTKEECKVNVNANKVCAEKGGEVDATATYSCIADNKPVPYCSQNSCSGYWHYAECDGQGNCDEDADEYYQESPVFAESGKVLDANCKSVVGSCGSSILSCYDSCTKGKKLFACDGFGECNFFWEWDMNSLIKCNPYGCSNDVCSKNCDEVCGAFCVPPASGGCGRCGTAECQSDCTWSECIGEHGCFPRGSSSCNVGCCSGGTQTCGSNCEWGACTGAEPASSQACGRCGSGTRTCGGNCQWGACIGESGCNPGSTGGSCACGGCCTGGTLTCNSDCGWECVGCHPDSSLCDIGCRSDCTCETG